MFGGRERVDAVGLPRATLSSPRALDLDDGVAGVLKVLAKPGAPAAGALDPEHELIRVAMALGPPLHIGIAGGSGGECELAQDLAELIQRGGAVAFLVGVDPDCDHRCLLISGSRSW